MKRYNIEAGILRYTLKHNNDGMFVKAGEAEHEIKKQRIK